MRTCTKQIATAIASGFLAFASISYADSGGSVIAGPADAPLVIEEFVDFSCHFCDQGTQTMKQVFNTYPGKIKLVLRNAPLPSHPNALVAAKAFTAVWLQCSQLANAFQAELFANQKEFNSVGEPLLYEIAAKVGADVDRMKLDMNSDRVTAIITQDQAAFEAHGFKGTPSFVIGTEAVAGSYPYSDIKKIVERQLGL